MIENTYGMLDHSLITDTPPFAVMGHPAMKTLLESAEFDAVYVAFDHLCPGGYRAIREHRMTIPNDISVLSSDGLDMHLYPELFSLKNFPPEIIQGNCPTCNRCSWKGNQAYCFD